MDRTVADPALETEPHCKGSEKHFLWSLSDNLPAHLENFTLGLPSSLAIYLLCNTLPAVKHLFSS